MQESGENYLETIFMLQKTKGSVRSIDVAAELGYTKASISRAMSILRKAGYITMAADGSLVLTDAGQQKASQIYERHLTITQYLVKALGVPEEIAEADACRIEHVISEETFRCMKERLQ